MSKRLLFIIAFVLATATAATATPPFIPILLPVYSASTHGAYGSIWVSELTLHSADPVLLVVCTIDCRNVSMPAGSHSDFLADYAAPAGQPPGLLIGIYEGTQLSISLRVRDISRSAQSFGVELPAIRPLQQDSVRQLNLLNVPLQPQFRYKLRLYDMSGAASATRVRAIDVDAAEEIAAFDVDVTPAPGRKTLAYAELDPFPPDVVAARAGHHIRVEVTRQDGQFMNWMWAFFTITNNETQEVTAVTPQ